MKRVITSFKNANKDLLNAIMDEFPNGVEDEVLINFPKVGGGNIRALEIELDDCLYLVKMENEAYYQKYLAKDEDDDEDMDDDDLDDADVPDDIEEEED